MNYLFIVYLAGGSVCLYFGAEWLVKGSSRLALSLGVSTLVVGLTIVAFGTSAPELVVSMIAGINKSGGIAVGNVVGSNIFNIALILGISSIIRPLKVNIKIIRIDAPFLVMISLLLWFILKNHYVSRTEASFLFSGILLYTVLTVYFGRKNTAEMNILTSGKVEKFNFRNLIIDIALIAAGLVGLVAGSRLFVKGAVDLAHLLKISETIIGLTIVSAGTSLPELATSVIASFKGEEDIAVGNIIGSNIFNILAILGAAGLVTPLSFSGIGIVDMAVMCGTTMLLLPLMRTGFRINRFEGLLLLFIYGFYMVYLVA
ncbi:MAG: calcium/sodium antiporter [Spirochaetes bacterium]|nr:calcium/sodium antiporter [Spirochaetota bacterium]